MRNRSSLLAVTVLVLASLPIPAGASERYVDVVFPDVKRTADIVYGEAVNSRGKVQELTLDLYEPLGDTEPFRTVYVWAHGGSFITGSKGSTGPILDYVRRGWVAVSIEYRLHHDMDAGFRGILFSDDPLAATEKRMATVRDAQRDMQAAVRWLRANAATYRLDASRIATGGFSAGAELALTVAFNDDDPADVAFGSERPYETGNARYPSEVAAGVSHAGVYAPGTHGVINPGEPPVAMLHGTDDPQVPFPSILPACVTTRALANVCELAPFVGEGHRVLGADVARDFLKRHVVDPPRRLTSLSYEGETHARGEIVEVAARLTGAGGDPFAGVLGADDVPLDGREVYFEVKGVGVAAETDADGRARATLDVPDHGKTQDVLVRFHGEPDLEPAATGARITWGRPG